MSRPASGDAHAAKHAAGGRRAAGRGTGDAPDERSATADGGSGAATDDDLGIASWLAAGTPAPDETGPLLSPLGGLIASEPDRAMPADRAAQPDRRTGSGRVAKHSRPIDTSPHGEPTPQRGRRSASGRINIEPDDPLGLAADPDRSAAAASPTATHDAPTAFRADVSDDPDAGATTRTAPEPPAGSSTVAAEPEPSTARAGSRSAGGRRAAGRRA
ncbi:hypothetical protein DY240_13090, partial [Jiangella rhizosphaerae]